MAQVSIMLEVLNSSGKYEAKKVPAFHVSGPWAVTTSVDPQMSGFVVTHTPTGSRAWPNAPMRVSLPEAIAMAEKLATIWADGGELPGPVRTHLAAVCGAA